MRNGDRWEKRRFVPYKQHDGWIGVKGQRTKRLLFDRWRLRAPLEKRVAMKWGMGAWDVERSVW
jgi:hypothetical protein